MLFAAKLLLALVNLTVPLPRLVTVSAPTPPVTLAATVSVEVPRLTKSALPESVSVSAPEPQV